MKKLIGTIIIFSLCFICCNSDTFRKNKDRKIEIYSIENNEEIFRESINNDDDIDRYYAYCSILYPNLEDNLPDDLLPERKSYVYEKKNFFEEKYELIEIITTFQHDGYIKKEIISSKDTQVFYYSLSDNIIF